MKDKVIIIPVHNQLSFLMKCIGSIIATTKNYKIIIVDDGSTDEDIKQWLSDNLLHCDIIRHDTPQGFSIACNDGIDYAIQYFDFNCLCLLNSDTEIVTENWFDIVESEFISRNNIGVAGVVSNNATHQTIKNVPQYLSKIINKPTINTHLVHGFCYFMSKNIITKIGRFDDDTFPHYGSEDDYSLKSIKNGFENIIVGSVFVKHNGATSYSTDTRATLVGTALPNLKNRWGDDHIKKSLELTLSGMNILNNNK